MFLFFCVLLFASVFGISDTPPMGWTSWCTDNRVIPCYDDFCNESEVLSIAKEMVSSGMVELGFEYILLDDCWASTNRTKNGRIQEDFTRFLLWFKACHLLIFLRLDFQAE